MYIGIDLGTSGVKAILLSEDQRILASHSEPLQVARPHPLWSEQDPQQWWQATDTALRALAAAHSLRGVKALGLSGQMHGATLLDKRQQVLRPAILWNDGRSYAQCQALEAATTRRAPSASGSTVRARRCSRSAPPAFILPSARVS